MSDDNALVLLAVHFLYARAVGTDRAADEYTDDNADESAYTSVVTDASVVGELAERLRRQGGRADASEIAATAAKGTARASVADAASLTVSSYDNARAAWLAESGTPGTAGERTWPPTSQTVMARLGGTWNAALRCAGVPVSAGGRKAGTGAYADDQMAAVVAEFLAADRGESFGAFSAWLKEKKETGQSDRTAAARSTAHGHDGRTAKLPSAAAVRKRFGTWNAAKEAACDNAAG